jgi:hypothetical protein
MQSSVIRELGSGYPGGTPGAVTGSPRSMRERHVDVEVEELLEEVDSAL